MIEDGADKGHRVYSSGMSPSGARAREDTELPSIPKQGSSFYRRELDILRFIAFFADT